MQIYLPPGTQIYRLWDYTLGQYSGVDRGAKYVHVFISDDDPATDPNALGLMRNGDEHKAMPYKPPQALDPTAINPASSFQANFTLPSGITEAKLYAFLDPSRSSIHPDYNGVIVTGSSHIVAIPTSGQYVEYVLESIKDGLPVSLTGNGKIVTTAGLNAKAAAMNLTAVDLNAATWTGTVTKDQTGLYSDSADLAAQVAGAGVWSTAFTDFDVDAMPDGHSVEFMIPYKLSSVAQAQRIAGFGSTTAGINAVLQWAISDAVSGDTSRFWMRNNNSGGIFDQNTIAGFRNTNVSVIYVQLTKSGTNFIGKAFGRNAAGVAVQLGVTSTVAISTSQVLFNVFYVAGWVRNTGTTNYTFAKYQDAFYKLGGVANSEVNILDLVNTGTLAA